MRILFSSTRGAGHLQPLLPYARALVARQHQVAVAAPADVSETLRAAGLPHHPFDRPAEEELAPIWARLGSDWGNDSIALVAREVFAGLNAAAALPKVQEAIRSFRPDLIVRDSVEYASLVAAEASGVRHARVAVHSVSFEEPWPELVAAPLDALRARAGLAADEGASLYKEPVFSSFPASFDRVPAGSRTRAAFRARVVEDPPSSAPAPWAPSADSRPLVYVTFGSLAGGVASARSIYRTALDAFAELPVRALLTIGRDLDVTSLGAIPANVHVEAWVPQRDVLPHVAALVCHGGSGTLLGALAAGLPLVVTPLGADQPHNGQLVAAAGAGLVLNKPDASALRAAIQSLLSDPEPRRQAQRLAGEIAAMPTIDSAIDVLLA